jgi:hypothetical protein
MRVDLSWTKTDILSLIPELTSEQAKKLGSSMFNAACERILTPKQNLEILDAIRAGLGVYTVRAHGSEEWSAVLADWRRNQRVYELKVLTDRLRDTPELTMEHLDIILDPERNTVLNSFGLSMKVRAFYKANPGTPRAKNVLGGTFLFAADENCKHIRDQRLYSGVNCARCPGWFCF